MIPAEGDPLPSDIEIYALNNESGMNYVSKVLMRDGSFIFILPPNVKYTVSYQQNGQEFMTEEWGPYEAVYKEIKKEFHLMPAKKGSPISVEKTSASNTNPPINKTDNITKKDNTTADKSVAVEKGTNANPPINKTDNTTKKDNATADKSIAVEKGTNTNPPINKTDNTTKKDNTINNATVVPTVNTISADGVVFDINCKPYANKNIDVINSKGDLVKTVTTNGKGGFMITKLVATDDYTLKAEDPEIRFCNKSKITYRDKNNKVISTKNFGEEKMVASKEKPVKTNTEAKTNDDNTAPKSEVKHEQLAKVHHRKFEMYFKYNVFETDIADEPFKKFIDNIIEVYKENGKINFNITSCASQVPTRKFASNKELSIARADKMKEQLLSALKEKGVDASNITFVKVKSIVGGPTYNSDYLTNKAVYEKFQYVKVSAF